MNFANDKLDNNPKDKNLKSQIAQLFDFINDIFGLGYQDSFIYFNLGLVKMRKDYRRENFSKK